jgi:hypothetical protein
MKRILTGLFGALLVMGVAEAKADIIIATFSGPVTSVSDPTNGAFTSGIAPGDKFTATVSYDTRAQPVAVYQGGMGADYFYLSSSLTIGNRVLPLDTEKNGFNVISIIYHEENSDVFLLEGKLASPYAGGSSYGVSLGDLTQSVFSGIQLPTNLNLGQFDTAGWGLALKPATAEQQPFASVYGTITSVSLTDTATAPEPGSLVLLGTAGVGLFAMTWRRVARRLQ